MKQKHVLMTPCRHFKFIE